jgi:hypothetical protein
MSDQQPNQPQNTPSWAQQQPQSPYGQPQPQWGQQPPQSGPQWGAPQYPQPPKKNRRGLKIALGIVGGLIVIGIISSAASGGGKKDDTADKTPATTAPAAAPTTTAAKAAAPAKPKPAPKPVTVLTEHGTGIKNTVKFTVHGDWDLHYTYDCANFGMQGNFAVTGMGGDFPNVMVNELDEKGTDTTHQHDGGTMYLQINSECAWTIKVIDLP